MRQIDNTTFTANGLGDVKPNVTIGGKDKIKFIPNINMSFFGDEFFINLNRGDKTAITSAVDGKAEIGGIDKDIFHIDEQGRVKWDIEFSSRPAVNSWTWELKHTKGIEFYYQGELTPEEITEGCERPDEVVGSYAVYCSKVNNKYKTGKLCHIYRPFCYDAKGNTIYADLKIADGQLTITVDNAWLDNAVYPVRLDPTIGYTTVGGSTWEATGSRAIMQRVISAAANSGTASKVYIYLTSGINVAVELGYYAGTSRISNSIISSPTGASWNNISVTGDITSGNSYYPAFAFASSGSGGVAYDTYTVGGYYNLLKSLPATWTGTDALNRAYSNYLEYTESASGGGLLVGASALVGGGVLCGQGNLIN